MTVWAGMFATFGMGAVGLLLYWVGMSLGLPEVVAMLIGGVLSFFVSRAVLRAIWQRQAEQAA